MSRIMRVQCTYMYNSRIGLFASVWPVNETDSLAPTTGAHDMKEEVINHALIKMARSRRNIGLSKTQTTQSNNDLISILSLVCRID